MATKARIRSAISRSAARAGRATAHGLRAGPAAPAQSRRARPRPCDARLRRGRAPPGFACAAPRGQWGYGVETSRGKDTPSGHWEIAGTPVDFDWGYFPQTIPAFPESLTRALIAEGGLPGILGDCHASGTAIIAELGEEHLRTLKPICYTSANSVLQIAAHEEAFGLERLYDLCRIARRLCDPLDDRPRHRPALRRRERAADFIRTANRKDFSIPPLPGNLLQRAARRAASRLDRQDRRHLRPSRHRARAQGQDNAANVDLTLAAFARPPTAASLRQPRRFRQRIRPSPRRARLRRLPRGVRRAAAARSPRRCAPTISAC